MNKLSIFSLFLAIITLSSCNLSKNITLESCPSGQIAVGKICLDKSNPIVALFFGQAFFDYINTPPPAMSPLSISALEEGNSDTIYDNNRRVPYVIQNVIGQFFQLNNLYCQHQAYSHIAKGKKKVHFIFGRMNAQEITDYQILELNDRDLTYFGYRELYDESSDTYIPKYAVSWDLKISDTTLKFTEYGMMKMIDISDQSLRPEYIMQADFEKKEAVFGNNPSQGEAQAAKLKIFDKSRIDVTTNFGVSFSGKILLIPEKIRRENDLWNSFVISDGNLKFDFYGEGESNFFINQNEYFSGNPVDGTPNNYVAPPLNTPISLASEFSQIPNKSLVNYPLNHEGFEVIRLETEEQYIELDKAFFNCLINEKLDAEYPDWYRNSPIGFVN